MSAGLSRRALLRALVDARPVETRPPDVSDIESVVRVAAISAACVEPKGVSCRRCGEVCDENAIRFSPLPGGRATPVMDTAMCSGCGECLAPCPVGAIPLQPRAATLVRPAMPEVHP